MISKPRARWPIYRIYFDYCILIAHCVDATPTEDARLQENAASDDLPDFLDDAAQVRHLDGYIADLLLRVRRSPLGHCSARCAVYGVRSQVPRKVQGPAERWLLTEWVDNLNRNTVRNVFHPGKLPDERTVGESIDPRPNWTRNAKRGFVSIKSPRRMMN